MASLDVAALLIDGLDELLKGDASQGDEDSRRKIALRIASELVESLQDPAEVAYKAAFMVRSLAPYHSLSRLQVLMFSVIVLRLL